MSLRFHRVPVLQWVLLCGVAFAAGGLGCELIASVDRSLIDTPAGAGGSGPGGTTSTGSMTGTTTTAGSGMTTTSGAGGAGGTGGTGGMTGVGGSSGFPYPTDLTAVINGPTVSLTWLRPDPGSGNTQVRLLRTLNAPPTGPTDATATVVYSGSLAAASHALSLLMPDMAGSPHTYHYAVYGCTSAMMCEPMGSSASIAPTIRQCLRGGGYNMFWRHASANVCADNTSLGTASTTSSPNWWKSCDANCPPPPGTVTATARQLNSAGYIESQSIGQSFATIGIPVGRVLSSEYCRCIQTAEGMSFGPMIEGKQELTYFVYDEANRCTNTMALLAQNTPAGQNVALISHAGFICPLLDSLMWGEAAIYKPNGTGGSTLITRILWDGWDALP